MFVVFVFKGSNKSVLNKFQYHHPVTMISLIHCKACFLYLPYIVWFTSMIIYIFWNALMFVIFFLIFQRNNPENINGRYFKSNIFRCNRFFFFWEIFKTSSRQLKNILERLLEDILEDKNLLYFIMTKALNHCMV